MAKTTKTPAKRANTKQNKNSKQVGIFGKSFDLKSRKVQFFVSIIIIAILGGGYFTFRSFAAASKELTYVAASQLKGYQLRNGTTSSQANYNNLDPNFKSIIETRSGSDKNKITVMQLPWRHGLIWDISGATKVSANKKLLNNQASLRICALASKVGTTGTANLEMGGFALDSAGKVSGNMSGNIYPLVSNGVKYNKYCTDLPRYKRGASSYQFWVFNRVSNGATIRIGKVSLELK